jgi:hypothetical protein
MPRVVCQNIRQYSTGVQCGLVAQSYHLHAGAKAELSGSILGTAYIPAAAYDLCLDKALLSTVLVTSVGD